MYKYLVSHRLYMYKSQEFKQIDEIKNHLLTNNTGYINKTADTFNETEIPQFR